MKYITKGYVKLAGTVLRPGEAFETACEDEKISRLLRLGAIERVIPEVPPVVLSLDNEQHGDGDDGEAPVDNQPDENDSEADDTDMAEAFEEEMEAPEIDVMEGISVDEPETETKAATSKGRGRKK